MFNKSKETQYDKPAPVHSSGKSEITTLLSEGCRFEGNMFAPSNTRVDGDVKGNINGQSLLVIGDKGIIHGDLNAVDVVIYGQVNGNIKSHKLELKKGCKLNGDIFVEVLVTEAGVIFNGKCNMEAKKPVQQQPPPIAQTQKPLQS
jgi:cytoskeletal protein CcmA (bactofilin family)